MIYKLETFDYVTKHFFVQMALNAASSRSTDIETLYQAAWIKTDWDWQFNCENQINGLVS